LPCYREKRVIRVISRGSRGCPEAESKVEGEAGRWLESKELDGGKDGFGKGGISASKTEESCELSQQKDVASAMLHGI
jgi:hypothetical protein